MKKNIAQRVEEIVEPITEERGFELVDVEYVKEAGMYYLKVIIDSERGVGLEECEEISKEISPILDEKNFIEENYFLEVSSPGIDRILKRDKEFKKYSGKEVEVKLYKNDEILKTKKIEATLIGLDSDGNIELIYNDNKISINRKEVAQIRLLVLF
ncbi:ribosome maturation factor RimP [Peptostreptococcus faecalis]|uniref:ribosome maturation factor RimP n=1 Tax=Peptostreptococcus faecalis TaxID=2045015 RepID=UPI000C7DB833|nr:ribosome maturation factor RimP [Peptostreptococcus faecalis]